MMRRTAPIFLGFLLVFNISCSSSTKNEVPVTVRESIKEKKKKEGENISVNLEDIEKAKSLRVNFGRSNWIDFSVKNSQGTIEAYSDFFQIGAGSTVYIKEEEKKGSFNEFCFNKKDEILDYEDKISGGISFYLNPLDREVTRTMLGDRFNKSIVRIINPLEIKNIEVSIIAMNLMSDEVELIKNSKIFTKVSVMGYVSINYFSFHPFFEQDLSRAFTKLLCGIVRNQAYLQYKITGKNGEFIDVTVDEFVLNEEYYKI